MKSVEPLRRSLKTAGLYLWREWIRPFGLFFLIVAPLKSAVVDWNWVPSGSMKPTILEGDLVFIDKLAYDLRVPFTTTRLAEWGAPARGDVVVCFSPADGTRLVKRVIGLPGDTIETRNNVLFVNGQAQSYSQVQATRYVRDVFEDTNPLIAIEHLEAHEHLVMVLPNRPALRSTAPFVVPDDHYFMMGDSRDNSTDSRFFGAVPRRDIIGRATGVLVSFDPQRFLLPRFSRWGRMQSFLEPERGTTDGH